MIAYLFEVLMVHDYPDFHQLMLGFYGREKYRAIHAAHRFLDNDDSKRMLYADLGRTVFTIQELDRLRGLLNDYADKRRHGLLAYTTHEVELPVESVAVFARCL